MALALPALALPEGPRGQALALGVTVLMAALAWFGMVAPALEWYADRTETLNRQHALARRMAALVATLPALRREAEGAGKAADDAEPLLSGASDAVAAALLQQRIDELAAAAGVRPGSEEILPAQPAGDLRAIAVRVTLNAPWKSLVGLLLALGRADIPMIAEDVQVRGLPAYAARGTDAGARVADAPVDASFTVTSFRAVKGGGAP